MVDTRNVNNFAVVTTVTSGSMTAGSPGNGGTFTIAASTNWPTANFCVVIDTEIIRCSARSGSTCTVATSGRGYAGSTAASHAANAVVTHQAVNLDYTDPNAHMLSTVEHGATGAVVGTTNTQTLTNKTISGASNTLSNIPEGSLSDRSRLYAYRNAAATIPASAANLLIAWDTELQDSAGTWTPAAALVFPVTGTYIVTAAIGWPSLATTVLTVAEWRVNAGGNVANGTRVFLYSQLAPNTAFNMPCVFPYGATAADTLECWVRQSSGSTGALGVGVRQTYAHLIRVSG